MGTEQHLQISELFHSIQGESTWAGYPCFFVRLAGCNLRCSYCDARYTYEEPAQPMSIPEILHQVAEFQGSLVEITGGEPLLQPGIHALIKELIFNNRLVLLETNGSLDISELPEQVVTVMDLKCPSSGMADKMLLSNLSCLGPRDEVKCVISSRQDYDWAVHTLNGHNLIPPPSDRYAKGPALLFSPETSQLAPAELAEWILADRLPVRLQLQLHKTVWPDQERGV